MKKMTLHRIPVLAVALAFAGACTGVAPVTSETITRVRVIAVRAEPAGAHPGDAVHLDALVVSPVPDDPDVAVTWYTCSHASFEECAKATDLDVIGHGASLDVTVPSSASPGSVLVFWIDAIKGGQVERALKSLQIVEAGIPPNRNPDLKSVRWLAQDTHASVTTVQKSGQLDVRVVARQAPGEIFFDSNENAAEDVRVLTYTTSGFLLDPTGTGASGELRFDAPTVKGLSGNWIVINDGRGGVDWKSAWINVTESKVEAP